MERKEKSTGIIFGLSISILAALQLISHPSVTMIFLKLKPVELHLWNFITLKIKFILLTCLIRFLIVYLLHIYPVHHELLMFSDREELRQYRDFESEISPISQWLMILGQVTVQNILRVDHWSFLHLRQSPSHHAVLNRVLLCNAHYKR